MSRKREGATLAEVVVVLLCGVVIVGLALSGLAAARSIGGEARRRADRLDAFKVTRLVLRAELRVGLAGRDWTVFPPDSVRLRAFRGYALVCPAPPGVTDLVVAWHGSRRPQPAKDSLSLLDARGEWTAADLVQAGPSARVCSSDPGAAVEHWEIRPAPRHPVVLARLFESSSYHLSDRALRYRVGRGGRQPLTPEVLDTRSSGFIPQPDSWALRLDGIGSPDWSWSGYLAPGR